MTRAQALLTMQALLPLLQASGMQRVTVDGLDGDRGQLMVQTPVGVLPVIVTLPDVFPVANLTALLATTQAAVTTALRPFEGECGRGFNGRRGKLAVGSPGYSANEGWV